MRLPRFSSETWLMLAMSAVFWAVAVVAVAAMVQGNPNATSALVACCVAGIVSTTAGVALARQDARWRR